MLKSERKMKERNHNPGKNESKTEKGRWILRLYVAGQSPKCITALENLKEICKEQLAGQYEIEVIDLILNPELGREHQILAIPTLVRKLPFPVRKIIGDLSNAERVPSAQNRRSKPGQVILI